jgi:hypothetical protein
MACAALRLVWATSRTLTILIAVLTLIAGVLPAAVAWVGQLIVDSVVNAAAQHRADGHADLGAVLAYVGLEAHRRGARGGPWPRPRASRRYACSSVSA